MFVFFVEYGFKLDFEVFFLRVFLFFLWNMGLNLILRCFFKEFFFLWNMV